MSFAPRSTWQWVCFAGVVAQVVLSLLLLTGDYSQAPGAIARDIRVVSVVTLLAALISSGCLPTAAAHKTARVSLVGMVVLTALVMFSAVIAGALTGWVIIPTVAMTCGLLLLYRELASTRARKMQDYTESSEL